MKSLLFTRWLNVSNKQKIFKILLLIISFQCYSQKIPGIDIAYCYNGKIIWAEGFGLADVEDNISVLPQKTLFRIGSVSKSITSVALGKLLD